jgi:hypothetical protein
MAPPGWFRLIRAGVFAAVCVVLAEAGHDLMASHAAPVWSSWTALAGVGAIGYCLADRRRPAWWIVLAVEVVQVCLHVWFRCCTPAGSGTVLPDAGAMPHEARPAMGAATSTSMADGAEMSAGMFGVHAVAGLLVAFWLYAGERAMWRALGAIAALLVGRTLRGLFLFIRGGIPEDPRTYGAACGRMRDEAEPAIAVLRHALIRRGPPGSVVIRVYASA